MSNPTQPEGAEAARNLETMLQDVPLQLTVELGRTTLSLGELTARLGAGSVIPLDRATGSLLDVRINTRLVARAEAIAVGERTAIRIVEIVDGKEP